jgi:hypothetical protein
LAAGFVRRQVVGTLDLVRDTAHGLLLTPESVLNHFATRELTAGQPFREPRRMSERELRAHHGRAIGGARTVAEWTAASGHLNFDWHRLHLKGVGRGRWCHSHAALFALHGEARLSYSGGTHENDRLHRPRPTTGSGLRSVCVCIYNCSSRNVELLEAADAGGNSHGRCCHLDAPRYISFVFLNTYKRNN